MAVDPARDDSLTTATMVNTRAMKDMLDYNQLDVQITERMHGMADSSHDLRELIEAMRLRRGPYGADYDGYNPEFEANYLWGPKGEWTGLPAPSEVSRRNRVGAIELGIPSGRNGPRDSDDRVRLNPLNGAGYAFHTYEMWARYTRARNPQLVGYRLELGTLWMKLDVTPEYAIRWLEAMGARDRKLACGVLRDADNAFGPFGLLAHINGAIWEWDEAEAAYSYRGLDGEFHGDTQELPLADICDFLGLTLTRTNKPLLDRFVALITILADANERFEQVVQDIRGSEQLYVDIKRQTAEAIHHLSPDYNRTPYLSPDYNRTPYFDFNTLKKRTADFY